MNKTEKIIVYFCIIIVTIVSICSIETNGKSNFMDIDIEYIKSKLDDYEDMTTNHIDDIEHLKKSEKDLKNKIELIDSKCDEIKVELYK